MDDSNQPPRANPMILDPANGPRHDASIPVHDRSTQLDHKGRTPAERHALFMTGFTNILQHEGLRSPGYYHDKSQCISFQDCSPAEMGIIKAERLKWGYIEPKELAKRLRQLKPSHNFTLKKYRPPQILWDKSPIPKTPGIEDIPDADWFSEQEYGIRDLKRRLGESLTKAYLDEVQNLSGTLFPRYLVKALWELLDFTHKRGLQHYHDKEDRAKRKMEEAIHQWQEEHPGEILADDAISIYRTWPAELMARLDEVDREAIREGRRLYMADLEKTGKKMQELVAFWRNCGLVTGTRTPPSLQWPDSTAKLRELLWPDYVFERSMAISAEFGNYSNECMKRTMILMALWKETVLHAHFDLMTSELCINERSLLRNRIGLMGMVWLEDEKRWRTMQPSEKQKHEVIWKGWESSELPLTQSLLQKSEVVWQGWESFIDDKYVEDEMIDVLSRWRRAEKYEPCSGTSSLQELDRRVDMPCSRPSRSNIRALIDGLRFLRKHPSNKRRPRDCNGLTMNSTTWLGRLRPRFEPQGALRRQLRTPEKLRKSSQRIVKSRDLSHRQDTYLFREQAKLGFVKYRRFHQ
ncbi:MAG: hypothetical protein MMC33_006466 [Icmadophila ericetorum]|nr:hypothetical protein [Icmadophila ericetorum]